MLRAMVLQPPKATFGMMLDEVHSSKLTLPRYADVRLNRGLIEMMQPQVYLFLLESLDDIVIFFVVC